MKPTQQLVDLTEKEWDAQVRDLALMLGWKRYHPLHSKGSAAGWPDLALVRDRLILIELKREKGKLSEPQKDWIRRLLHAGVETYVARPHDLEKLAAVMTTSHGHQRPEAAALREATSKEVAV